MCGTGGIGKSLYLPFSFVVNLKLLYKSKVLKKKKIYVSNCLWDGFMLLSHKHLKVFMCKTELIPCVLPQPQLLCSCLHRAPMGDYPPHLLPPVSTRSPRIIITSYLSHSTATFSIFRPTPVKGIPPLTSSLVSLPPVLYI